ncbi:hypothetical protein HMP0015_1826 [Acinetobacter haemolyticus ATCC 19194]|uniref:Uncharacterized protein n=1 Tax=Acinetobacter haemolyticus ATCC 19194 TaxID=707232 RepID=D4XQ34_ACIHA|nr:hypothetical protein HMPREF0023_2972 [Acinetobacter sp. ATCC 27244]EFF82697.1 hypothetical protein HMP0015_1826 [Acinetobacter haemolyticus ATCC 19194]
MTYHIKKSNKHMCFCDLYLKNNGCYGCNSQNYFYCLKTDQSILM